uniref:Uncharacterized protein n=1 Tax=Arundo donax TaxID=35708 RepID=A0A0A8ZH54_ARUDO
MTDGILRCVISNTYRVILMKGVEECSLPHSVPFVQFCETYLHPDALKF